MSANNRNTENLVYKVIASLKNEEEIKMFFDDLCTNKEVEQMTQRLMGAILLLEKKTYQQVTSATVISSATLSRVSRCIQYGSGGYNTLLKRYLDNEEKE